MEVAEDMGAGWNLGKGAVNKSFANSENEDYRWYFSEYV